MHAVTTLGRLPLQLSSKQRFLLGHGRGSFLALPAGGMQIGGMGQTVLESKRGLSAWYTKKGSALGVLTADEIALALANGGVRQADGSILFPDGSKWLPDGTGVDAQGNVEPNAFGNGACPSGQFAVPTGPGLAPLCVPPQGLALANGDVIQKDGTVDFKDGSSLGPDGTYTSPSGSVVAPDGTIEHLSASDQASALLEAAQAATDQAGAALESAVKSVPGAARSAVNTLQLLTIGAIVLGVAYLFGPGAFSPRHSRR